MRKQLLLLSFVLISLAASAQITISNSSFPSVGDTQILHHQTSGITGISVGNLGANIGWNFSSMQSQSTDTTLIVAVSSTPFASSFPTATLAALQTGGNIGYLKSTATDVELIGAAASFFTGGINIPTTAAHYSSPNILAKAGITYQSKYNYPTAIAQTIVAPAGIAIPGLTHSAVDSIRLTQTSTVFSRVDGYGTVTTPKGTYACIRQKDSTISNTNIEVHVIDTVIVGLPPLRLWQSISKTNGAIAVSYSFKDNNSIVDITTLNMDSTSNTINNVSYREKNGVTTTPLGIFNLPTPSLFTIYPNPAQSHISALIGGLPEGNYVLMVYNIYGQELLSQKCSVTSNAVMSIDLSQLNLSTGNYLMTIANSNGMKLQSQKFEVLK